MYPLEGACGILTRHNVAVVSIKAPVSHHPSDGVIQRPGNLGTSASPTEQVSNGSREFIMTDLSCIGDELSDGDLELLTSYLRSTPKRVRVTLDGIPHCWRALRRAPQEVIAVRLHLRSILGIGDGLVERISDTTSRPPDAPRFPDPAKSHFAGYWALHGHNLLESLSEGIKSGRLVNLIRTHNSRPTNLVRNGPGRGTVQVDTFIVDGCLRRDSVLSS